MNTKSAFIAIVGRPNAGKSTILNALVGQKIAAVSSKPQTTRTRITGVLTRGDTQLVFIDTPGFHKPKNTLGKHMVRSVNEGMGDVDAVLFVVPSDRKPNEIEFKLIEQFKNRKLNAILAINKIDLLKDKNELLELIGEYSALFDFREILPISAATGNGMDLLIKILDETAVPSPFYFAADTLTDQNERVLAAEMIREKLLERLDKEIPHGIAVFVESFKERDNGILDIEANIFCEKESHKRIVIGKNGAVLKAVGTAARIDAEDFFECKVNLQLWVKVKEDWRNREGLMRQFGLD